MNIQKKKFSFSKEEHLCSRKTIEKIFSIGKPINESPLRLIWIENNEEEKAPLKVAISVPKRNFKKAVDRNKIKRQIREAYRLNKEIFISEIKNDEKKFACIIVFTGRKQLASNEIETKISITLQRFVKDACKK